MKFLIALSILATTSAFSGVRPDKIKCYEPAQQGSEAEVAYVLLEKEYKLLVIYPHEYKGQLWRNQDGCLEQRRHEADTDLLGKLKFCPGQGQTINGYVPVEVTNAQEETVYCDKAIEDWFSPASM